MAKIPIFHFVWGGPDTRPETPGSEKWGIRRLIASADALYFVSDELALSKVQIRSEKVQKVLGHSKAQHAFKGVDGLGYPIQHSDILCALDENDSLFVGTRRGLVKYNPTTRQWEESDEKRFKKKSIQFLINWKDEHLIAITDRGIEFSEKAMLPHPKDDRFIRLDSSNEGIIYSTEKGGLGLIQLDAARQKVSKMLVAPIPIVLIGSGKCRAPYESFTSACQLGDEIYFGTDGYGIVIYDGLRRKWRDGYEKISDKYIGQRYLIRM